jgi:hypothetical protein
MSSVTRRGLLRIGAARLVPLSSRDAAANDLTAAFDFTQTPAS